MDNKNAIELIGISKYFGEVVANEDISITVKKGEILALLGENGSGKTTLMNMISGIYYPDKGEIIIDGEEAKINAPKDAFKYGIGMVHQHFKLIDVFSATDNIILGEEFKYSIKKKYEELKEQNLSKKDIILKTVALPFKKFAFSWKNNLLSKNRGEEIQTLANKYGFDIDVNKKIYDMSVSEKQTVEILKVLYRGANLLILDEPTAVLTPQETDKLFEVLRKMKADGKSIIIITHKLNEVLAISDKVSILRKGHYIGTIATKEANEQILTEMMVGTHIELNINRLDCNATVNRLNVKNLTITNHEGISVVKNVSFSAKSGEILGIAGIAGAGQKELLEAIAGLQQYHEGEITYLDPDTNCIVDLKTKTPKQIRDLGVRLSFVPEDRLGMGLVGNMNISDNVMLRSFENGNSIFLDKKAPKDLAEQIVDELEVVTPSVNTPIRNLSGGNVQKVLVGREIATSPTVFMAAYPVRGLDINSSYTIYNLLNAQKQKGVAVIYVGEDLDVLVQLCDRIIVLCAGEITGQLDARKTNKEEIGILMTKTNSSNMEVKNND